MTDKFKGKLIRLKANIKTDTYNPVDYVIPYKPFGLHVPKETTVV